MTRDDLPADQEPNGCTISGCSQQAPRREPRRTRGVALATVLGALAVGLALVATVFVALDRHSTLVVNGDRVDSLNTWSVLVDVFAYAAVGWALASRRPEVLFGWLALVTAVTLSYSVAAVSLGVWVIDGGGHVPGLNWFAWAANWSSIEPLATVITWALFPTGRLPRGRIRWLALLSIGLCAVATLQAVLGPHRRPVGAGTLWQPAQPAGHRAVPVVPVRAVRRDWPAAGLDPAGGQVAHGRWGRNGRYCAGWACVNLGAIALVPARSAHSPGVRSLGDVGTVVSAAGDRGRRAGQQRLRPRRRAQPDLGLRPADRCRRRRLLGRVSASSPRFGLAAGGLWGILAAVAAAFCLAPARQRVTRLVNRFLYGERDDPYAVLTPGRHLAGARRRRRGTAAAAGSPASSTRCACPTSPSSWPARTAASVRIEQGSRRPGECGSSVRFPLVHRGTAGRRSRRRPALGTVVAAGQGERADRRHRPPGRGRRRQRRAGRRAGPVPRADHRCRRGRATPATA